MSNPYDIQPIEYDMSNLERHSTYDQFLSLRDTLVFSGKRYAGKAGSLLCIGEKEKTVEVIYKNLYRQFFNDLTTTADLISIGPYLKYDSNIAGNPIFGNLSGVVQKDGWYRLVYKMEVLPTSNQNKIYTYFDIYRPDNGSYILVEAGGSAVFDWEGNTSLSGSTSGTEPNGSCTVSITLGKLFKKMTAFGYIEKNLKKGDIVVMRAKDAERGPNLTPDGNDLTLQPGSNYFSIEYLNLPYNS